MNQDLRTSTAAVKRMRTLQVLTVYDALTAPVPTAMAFTLLDEELQRMTKVDMAIERELADAAASMPSDEEWRNLQREQDREERRNGDA